MVSRDGVFIVVVSAAINISATTNQYSVAHVSEIVYPLST
jgi:hypothetical protein